MTTTSETNIHLSKQLPFLASLAVQQSVPFEQTIDVAVANGCTRVYVDGSYREDRASTWDAARVRAARALLERSGLRAIFHGNYKLPLSHENDEVRAAAVEAVKREVDVASELGAAPLIVHASSIFTHREPLAARIEAIAAFVKSIEVLVAHAAPRGVELWIENLEDYRNKHPFHTVFSKRTEYVEVMSRVPEVKFIFDVGHENVGGRDPVSVFESLADRIVALDLNDNAGEHDTHHGLGKGTVDFRALLRAAARLSWRGHITLETRGSSVTDDLRHLVGLLDEPRS